MTGLLVRKALEALAGRRPVFHSEADFQHELAVEISRLDPDIKIRLERPVYLLTTRPIYVDILLHHHNEYFAVEVKYITAELESDIEGEEYRLKTQAARDLRRYDILKDIMRIEMLATSGVVTGGMMVTISNDRILWNSHHDESVIDHAFHLYQGRTVTGALNWATHAGPGTVRGRESAVILKGKYLLDWQEYSRVKATRNGEFRMLIAEVGPIRDFSLG